MFLLTYLLTYLQKHMHTAEGNKHWFPLKCLVC